MKPIIKKVKNTLKIATASLLIAGTLTVGTAIVVGSKYDDYMSTEEINEVIELLDCDDDYLRQNNGDYYRMEHNGDEPIYVFIDDRYTEEEKVAVQKSLDTIFGIVGTINNKYKYKIVNESEFNSKIGKTKIFYTLKDDVEMEVDNALAQIHSEFNMLNRLTEKKLMNNFTVRIDREKINNSSVENQLYLSMLHEGGHAFSCKDIYDIVNKKAVYNKNACNTFMNPEVANTIGMFTPNDIKCWISVYSESVEDAKNLQPYLEEYTEKYYDEYTKKCFEKVHKLSNFNEKEFVLESELTQNMQDGTVYSYLYNVTVSNGEYKFKILDNKTGKILENCSGEVEYINGVAVLREVRLKKGFQPYSEINSYK